MSITFISILVLALVMGALYVIYKKDKKNVKPPKSKNPQTGGGSSNTWNHNDAIRDDNSTRDVEQIH
jgi:hypothetical protein